MLTRRFGFSPAQLFIFGLLGGFSLNAAGQTTSPVTFVKTYGNMILNTTQQKDVAPIGVQATSDGGYILLASTDCPSLTCDMAQPATYPTLVNWLVKTDSSGNPQWQTELGCPSAPPGDYTVGVSLQQTTGGGYIVGGGSFAQGANCGASTSQRALVERLDSAGKLLWSNTYASGEIFGIRQTTDGGFVAAGGGPGSSAASGLVLKLDASGNLQWQKYIGPSASQQVLFHAIQQTSDGGYVTTGNYYVHDSNGNPLSRGLVVKLGANGSVQWQRALNAGSSAQVATYSITQASDGSYVATGSWDGTSLRGGLVVKLGSSGNILWQRAYTGGIDRDTGAVLGVVIYSVHQTADGGYFLAGDGNDILANDALEPWLGKVDSNGNLLWHYFYFQVFAATGVPLGENFAGGDVAKDGGFVAAGFTENYEAQRTLLFVVKTDRSGLCQTCADIHPDLGLTAIQPGLTAPLISFPISTVTTARTNANSQTKPTAVDTVQDCPQPFIP